MEQRAQPGMKASGAIRSTPPLQLSFEQIEDAMRRRNFGILCSLSGDNRPHSTGVLYAVSAPRRPFALYVTTNTGNKKARNIARNSNVSFTIPIPRSLLRFLWPHCIQFQGSASIISIDDEVACETFNRSILLKRVLKREREHFREKAIFIKIHPDPIIHTYGLGVSLIDLLKDIGKGSSSVRIPSSRLESQEVVSPAY